MTKWRRNRPLVYLAMLGIILYVFVAMTASGGPEEEAARPRSDHAVITKQDAAKTAAAYLKKEHGLSPDFDTFTTYQTHKSFSGYLQKMKLYDKYEADYIGKYPIDFFVVEVVDNRTFNRYRVQIHFRDNKVIGWKLSVPDTAKRQELGSASPGKAAQAIRQFGYDDSDFQLVRQSANGSILLYESKSVAIGESKLQLEVSLFGNEVTGITPKFSIPASYESWQEKQDASSQIMSLISLGFTLVMAILALAAVIKYRKYITFRHGLGLTAIFTVVYCIQNMNMYPAFKATYESSASLWEALSPIFIMNFIVFLMAGSVYVSLLAGREMWLSRGWNPWIRPWEPIFEREILAGMGRGYLLCLFILGVQQLLFYIGEESFDVWAVNDPTDSVYNMLVPALFPLMAWVAAISEEATFRLFGIVLFQRLVGNRFIAVLLPSMIWALSHTQYPIYPVYTRFVEVTIIGIIFGYAFLKFGFITVVFAHASMDSLLMGLSLVDSGGMGNTATGILYIAFPAIAGYATARFHQFLRQKLAVPPQTPPLGSG